MDMTRCLKTSQKHCLITCKTYKGVTNFATTTIIVSSQLNTRGIYFKLDSQIRRLLTVAVNSDQFIRVVINYLRAFIKISYNN